MSAEDGQSPLAGILLCCSGLLRQTSDAVQGSAREMGAATTLDLTMDVTHLVVNGNTTTAKYKYVAKARMEVKVVLESFINAARDIWLTGGIPDVPALEEMHKAPPLFGVHCSLTGFTTAEREDIITKIKANGGIYSGDLEKNITTHLIAKTATGKKHEVAPRWGISVVGVEWLDHSVERGMVLEETLYSVSMPPEERGKGAWERYVRPTSPLGKRQREDGHAEGGGKRTLRRTVSTKLSNHQDAIWADISTITAKKPQGPVNQETGFQSENEMSTVHAAPKLKPLKRNNVPPHRTFSLPSNGAKLLEGCVFYIHNFHPAKLTRLRDYIIGNGGIVYDFPSTEELGHFVDQDRSFVLVPSDVPEDALERPPQALQDVPMITEWWIELCLSTKQLPDLTDLFARPFFNGRIKGFESLTISSTGFTDVPRLHVARLVDLLGAKYTEKLSLSVTLYISATKTPANSRLRVADHLRIPVIHVDWLWKCVQANTQLDFENDRVLSCDQQNSTREKSQNLSFETTKTLSVPSDDLERRMSTRSRSTKSRENSGNRNNPFMSESEGEEDPLGMPLETNDAIIPGGAAIDDSDTKNEVAAHEISNHDSEVPDPPQPRERIQRALEAPLGTSHVPSASDTNALPNSTEVTDPPQTDERVLKEVSHERLNSPTKSTSSTTGTPQALENTTEAPGAKLERTTSALTSMLEAKRASRADSKSSDSLSRRKRTLGRAQSSGTENMKLSRPNSPQKQQSLELGESIEMDLAILPLQSQKIVYEDQTMQDHRERLLAELRGEAVPVVETPKQSRKKSRRQSARNKTN